MFVDWLIEGTVAKAKCAAESDEYEPYDKTCNRNDLNEISRMIGRWIQISRQWEHRSKLVCTKDWANKELLQITKENTNKIIEKQAKRIEIALKYMKKCSKLLQKQKCK